MKVDESGKALPTSQSVAISGFLRKRGEGDSALNRLFNDMGLLSFRK